MSRSAISSDPRGLVGLGAAVAVALIAAPAGAQEALTQQEALRLAFPEPAEISRETAFLREEQLARARELAGGGADVEQGVVTYYVGREAGEVLGVAYFDAHVVRTLREVLMVVVAPGGAVDRVEVLRFNEPPEYRPPEGWLEGFRGLERSGADGVEDITGATLTSRAVRRAVQRVLALHRVIDPLGTDGGGSR